MSLLKSITKRVLLFCSLLLPHLIKAQSITWIGVVKDAATQLPVSYASIGVKGKPVGTIADSLGNFKLSFTQDAITSFDTLIISSIGYSSLREPVEVLVKGGALVLLKPSPAKMLNEVVINASKDKLKVYGRGYGNISLNPRAYSQFPRVSDVSGREQATVLDIDNNMVLKDLNFLLSHNNYTKIKYRLNIYTVNKEDQPDKLLPIKDIIYESSDTHGWKTVGLKKYNIHLKGYKKLAFALQLLEADIAPNDTSQYSFLVPSYPSPFKRSYFREKSESNWIPVKHSYLYLNISAFKVKGEGKQQELEDKSADR